MFIFNKPMSFLWFWVFRSTYININTYKYLLINQHCNSLWLSGIYPLATARHVQPRRKSSYLCRLWPSNSIAQGQRTARRRNMDCGGGLREIVHHSWLQFELIWLYAEKSRYIRDNAWDENFFGCFSLLESNRFMLISTGHYSYIIY